MGLKDAHARLDRQRKSFDAIRENANETENPLAFEYLNGLIEGLDFALQTIEDQMDIDDTSRVMPWFSYRNIVKTIFGRK